MDSGITGAIVGCGRMGAFTSEVMQRHAPACWFPLSHAEAMRQHPAVHLRAFCDVDQQALERAGQAHDVAGRYQDFQQMLDEVRPRLLGIATRTIGRAGLLCRAIDSGVKALHVEKPLCNGMRELDRLASLFGSTDALFVTYGAIRRHMAPYRAARDLVDSGHYGPLREIRVGLGSAALFWTHPHSIDMILFGAGRRIVTGVQARLADVTHGASLTDIRSDPRVVAAVIHFEDGITGHITQALGSDLVLSCSEAEIIVRADGAAIDVYATDPGCIYPRLTPLPLPVPDARSGTLAAIEQLVACMSGEPAAREANAVVQRDLLLGQRIAFAMAQSHLEGSRIVDPAQVDIELFIHAETAGRHA
jgi:scyllo-inositol 2-dehydrogenase (NAD+)